MGLAFIDTYPVRGRTEVLRGGPRLSARRRSFEGTSVLRPLFIARFWLDILKYVWPSSNGKVTF